MGNDIHDFIAMLHEEIDCRSPNTERFIIKGGDYVWDLVLELREGNHRMQYCPYELFLQADGSYEDIILVLCKKWQMAKLLTPEVD